MTEGFGRNGDTREIEVNDNVCKFLIALNINYEDKFMEHCGLSEIFYSLKSKKKKWCIQVKERNFLGLYLPFGLHAS